MGKKISKKQIVENYLLSEISKGTYKVGDLIPSELELTNKFGFGRQTVHSALSELALKGYITRTAGKGSFVSQPSVNRNIRKKSSFTEDMKNSGMVAGSTLLEFKIIKAKEVPDVAKELRICPNEPVYYIFRIRTGNNIPIALQYTYIPTKYIKHLDLSALENSLDNYIEQIGLKVTGFLTKLKAVEGTNDQLAILETNSRALLNSISIRFLDIDSPFQYTSSLYRSDLYEYTFSSFN